MRIYKSKVGVFFMILVILLGKLASENAYEQTWVAFIIVSVVLAFFLHLMYSTYYKITGKVLQVKSSVMINTSLT